MQHLGELFFLSGRRDHSSWIRWLLSCACFAVKVMCQACEGQESLLCFLQAQALCYFAEKKQQLPEDIAGPLSVFYMHFKFPWLPPCPCTGDLLR